MSKRCRPPHFSVACPAGSVQEAGRKPLPEAAGEQEKAAQSWGENVRGAGKDEF